MGSLEPTVSVGSLSSVAEAVGLSFAGTDVDSLAVMDGWLPAGVAIFPEQAVSASRVRTIISNIAFFMALSSD